MSANLSLCFQARLVTEVCFACGVCYAFPQEFERARRKDKGTFYCPNGHRQCYTESEADRVRREMQAQIDAATNRAEMWKRESESTKRQLTSTKAALTKTKRRINNGVCPVCKRNFVALGKHMRGQHPDFATTGERSKELDNA